MPAPAAPRRNPHRPGRLAAVLALALSVAAIPADPLAAAPADPAAAGHQDGAGPVVLATPDGEATIAQAMNRRGEVLGIVNDLTGASQGALWRSYDGFTALPMQRARAFNDAGHVIGDGTSEIGAGYLWRDGELTYLRYPSAFVVPVAINDRDEIVGEIQLASGEGSRAFLWRDGGFTLLPTPGGMRSHATGVNDHGEVIGYLVNRDWSSQRAVLWRGGVMVDLGTLGGDVTTPVAINNSCQIVGMGEVPGLADGHPFLWQNGRIRDLVATTSASSGRVYAINDAGVAVGEADSRAVLWRGGNMTYLGGADTVSTARVINDRGDVGGTTYPVTAASRYEQTRAFRWRDGRLTILDALPEPRGVTVVGIDDRGRLAGTVSRPVDSRAVVWDVGAADDNPRSPRLD